MFASFQHMASMPKIDWREVSTWRLRFIEFNIGQTNLANKVEVHFNFSEHFAASISWRHIRLMLTRLPRVRTGLTSLCTSTSFVSHEICRDWCQPSRKREELFTTLPLCASSRRYIFVKYMNKPMYKLSKLHMVFDAVCHQKRRTTNDLGNTGQNLVEDAF